MSDKLTCDMDKAGLRKDLDRGGKAESLDASDKRPTLPRKGGKNATPNIFTRVLNSSLSIPSLP
jgi:hypothetical protein